MALPQLTLFVGALLQGVTSCQGYFADWSTLGGRPDEPTCVDIPKNMSLCADIGYDKMRLPNLLNHDTLTEALQQAGSWVPLLNVRCHKHTKLFLCSLFSPVCLENQIFPCRSLCQSVQAGCEARMKAYGYDWPSMFACDRFPLDNDMCIKSFDEQVDEDHLDENLKKNGGDSCEVCSPVDTYENILDNYCRSDFVIVARIRRQKRTRVKHRTIKIFKSRDGNKSAVRKSKMALDGESACCSFATGKQKYLIMGRQDDQLTLKPTFVIPWRKTKDLRVAARSFGTLRDCTNPDLFSSSSLAEGEIVPLSVKQKGKNGKKNRRKGRNKNRKKNQNGKNKQKKKDRKERRKNRRKKERINSEVGNMYK